MDSASGKSNLTAFLTKVKPQTLIGSIMDRK
jgi:hypothetical protein